MRRMILLVAASVIAGCQTPMPAANPEMAWVDLSIPFPNDRVLLAERLDKQHLEDGRFFQVTPGRHELVVKFDYETSGGGGMSMMGGPSVRECYLTVDYGQFTAGQRYVLEARSIALNPEARLYDGAGKVVAEVSEFYCLM
ncbi:MULTISPECIES: PA0061/PA0062 family lipoprotein [Pseudomonas]|uniref:PA0061/PA0062 family lipoprotein n=1 Tax=Pseudomonas TaxID=286 RepID=UPI001E616120|nr:MULTISPECIES: hypothetical protein [Pseudomonas]MCE1118596.1 hypothetical protein [Pseudomonas sp. NMI795_08]